MKPDRIKISKEFHINGEGLWLTCEQPIAPDENTIEEFKKGVGLLVETFQILTGGQSSAIPGHPLNVTQVESAIPVKMEDAINSCTNMTVLVTYKLLVKGKPELQAVYDKKVIELSK